MARIETSAMSLPKRLLNRLPRGMRNKYVLSLLLFVVYIAFFDHYSLYKQWQLKQTLSGLQQEKAQYVRTIEDSEQLRATIKADEVKFARERYLMKAADEDVFLID